MVSRENNSDKLEVQVEMTPEMFSDAMSQIAMREKELVDASKPCWASMPASAGGAQDHRPQRGQGRTRSSTSASSIKKQKEG